MDLLQQLRWFFLGAILLHLAALVIIVAAFAGAVYTTWKLITEWDDNG